MAVGAEPMTLCTLVAAHASTCAHCAGYRRRVQALDRAVLAALHVRAEESHRSLWSIAAGVILSIAIGATIWMAGTRPSFADDVIAHARQEPASLVHTLDVVPDAELSALLERAGIRLRPGIVRVSYARGCWLHGYYAPHLVVQSDHGPVTVLVLPHEPARRAVEHVHASGFDAVIVPAARGVLVAVGPRTAVEIVAQNALHALEYSSRS